MNYDNPKLHEALASEYVLGTLHGAARRRFERLLQTDTGLQEVVHVWEQRLNSLADAVIPREPPPMVWEILQELITQPTLKNQAV